MTSIILLSVFGIINLFMGFLRSNKVLLPGAMLLLLAVFGANYADWNVAHEPYFNHMLVVDNYTVAFTGIVLLTTILLLPFSRSYVVSGEPNLAEYYALLLFSLVGAIMMIGYDHLLMLFVGIEILSISMYVGSSRVDLQACKLEYSIVSPK